MKLMKKGKQLTEIMYIQLRQMEVWLKDKYL